MAVEIPRFAKVAVRFGATEIELTRAQLEALRRLARRLAQMAQ